MHKHEIQGASVLGRVGQTEKGGRFNIQKESTTKKKTD
jgi:hypothetical protein